MKKKMIAVLSAVIAILVLLPSMSADAAALKKGSKGTDVKHLQRNLTAFGYSTGGVDSSYGTKTKNAVLQMQKELGLEETGAVSEEEWTLIMETMTDIQRYLKEKGYYSSTLDGSFGNGTKTALKNWQKKAGYEQSDTISLEMMKDMLEDTSVSVKMEHLTEWVARLEGTYGIETAVQPAVTVSKEYITHVQNRLDDLLSVLEGKYFTETGKACLEKRDNDMHECDNCMNSNVLSETWFKEIFGEVDVYNLPELRYDAETTGNIASSSIGFAVFAQWFVFAASNDYAIESETVAEGKFTKEFVMQNVVPGDVLRLDEKLSVIVYAVEEDGIEIVDCNGRRSDLNCRVRSRKLTYEGDYKNRTVYVDRAQDVDIEIDSDLFYHIKDEIKDVVVRPVATSTPTPVPTATATPTPKATATPTPKATATPTPKATVTPTPKATATPTPRATATPTPTPKGNAITMQEKLDQLLEKLGANDGKAYFTVNRKACGATRLSSHGCANCLASNIITTSWFKELFGEISVSNFPTHDVNGSRRAYNGKSCFGFACFAQWYLFADDASENVVGQRVAAVTFNKTNLMKYAKPGDVIRVNGHSIVVYSVESDGLWVVDSNWNTGGQLNCVVQKWFVKYTNSYMAGYTAYINRPTKASELEDGMAGMFDVE